MDKSNFDAELNALKRNYYVFKKYLLLMIISNVILVIALVFNTNREKVVLMPQVAPEYKMWINKSLASPEYLTILSRNVLDLLLNITPDSVKAQHQELMHIITPKYRAELQLKLTEIDKQITQNNLSQNFYIENIKIFNKDNVVYIRGVLNQYIDKNSASATQQIYKLVFIVQNYLPELTSIELIPANDPQLRDSQND